MSQEPHDKNRPPGETADDNALVRAITIARHQEAMPTAQSRALVDRIVAAAVAERASRLAESAGDGRVVPLRRAPPVPAVVTGKPARRRAALQVAALLAASLVAGIYVGGLGDSLAAVQVVASTMGLETMSGEVFQALAGDETVGDTLEDTL